MVCVVCVKTQLFYLFIGRTHLALVCECIRGRTRGILYLDGLPDEEFEIDTETIRPTGTAVDGPLFLGGLPTKYAERLKQTHTLAFAKHTITHVVGMMQTVCFMSTALSCADVVELMQRYFCSFVCFL
jgi:hypothetical protein